VIPSISVHVHDCHVNGHIGNADSSKRVIGDTFQPSSHGDIVSHHISVVDAFDLRQGFRIIVAISMGTIGTSPPKKPISWCAWSFPLHICPSHTLLSLLLAVLILWMAVMSSALTSWIPPQISLPKAIAALSGEMHVSLLTTNCFVGHPNFMPHPTHFSLPQSHLQKLCNSPQFLYLCMSLRPK